MAKGSIVKNGIIGFLLITIIWNILGKKEQVSTKKYGSVYADLISVYDGDTIVVDIPEFPDIIGQKIGIRIYGIDAPEMDSSSPILKEHAIKAKKRLKAILSKPLIELKNLQRDKYFRIVAEIFVDGQNINEIMIKENLAKPYYGGTKIEWKEEDIK